ncbi:hypothetical protein [Cytobacillus sp. IB215665]|uniref:hypothetical protein n=1 Tax=Cytobacillus sp. IB215665 TaxID=3097357 RepID=UPI002A17F379|nr:hypothetical protein [Cytobacillus sp. IB215665]MDX8367864.1 hypothetical protein [Cytobacillus sp. IB215665]
MIILKESKIQFKNPILGQSTRAVEEHYHARRIVAIIDGEERNFRFMKNKLPFVASEEEMIEAIEAQLNEESNA